jgi:hypothetical protein
MRAAFWLPARQLPGFFWSTVVPSPNVFSVSNMRALTEEEMKTFFEKLANFIGPSIKDMLDRSDEPHVFRLHKDRVSASSRAPDASCPSHDLQVLRQ